MQGNNNAAAGTFYFSENQTSAPGNAKTGQANGNIYSYSALLDYHFSKRSDVYAGVMYSQYKGDDYPSSVYNSSNYITAVGIRHKF